LLQTLRHRAARRTVASSCRSLDLVAENPPSATGMPSTWLIDNMREWMGGVQGRKNARGGNSCRQLAKAGAGDGLRGYCKWKRACGGAPSGRVRDATSVNR